MNSKLCQRLLPLLVSPLLWAAPTSWKVDPAASKITVDVRSTADDFTAKLTTYTAELTGDTTAPAAVSSVKVSWDMAHLDTGDAKRDKHMCEWCDPKTHPSNSWTLSSFETRDKLTIAKGKLNLHGVTKDIEFPVTITRNPAGNLVVDGSATFDHRDFGLEKIRSFLVLTVNPVVTVNFHLEAKAAPLAPASPATPVAPKANP